MPIKSVKHDVAEAINNLTTLLKRDYGCDFAYTVMGNGFILAQHNINGVQQPIPIISSVTTHPFVATPNGGPCSSCGKKRSDKIHKIY